MPESDVADALKRLEDACGEVINNKDAAGDKSTAKIILAGVRCAQERLQTVETAAVLPQRWSEIVEAVNPTITHVRRGPNHLSYPSNSFELDDFLIKIQSLPVRTRGGQQRIAGDVLSQIRSEVQSIVGELITIQEQHTETLHSLKRQVATAAEELEAGARATNQLKKEAEAAEARRSKAFDQQTSRFEQTFGTFESQSRERLDSELQRYRENFDRSATEFGERFMKLNDDACDRTAAVLQDLERHLSHAEEIVGVVSKTALAGSYSEVAQRERKDANTWRWISVTAMVGIIACAIFALAHSLYAGFSPSAFTAKVITSFAFMILAAYAGRESARHRKSEQHARRMQLELATIDSYLLSLPEEQRHAIKAAVADRIFGQPVEGGKQSADSENAQPPLLEYLRLAIGGTEKIS